MDASGLVQASKRLQVPVSMSIWAVARSLVQCASSQCSGSELDSVELMFEISQ